MEQIGNWIADILGSITSAGGNAEVEQKIRAQVAELGAKFPIYLARVKGRQATANTARG